VSLLRMEDADADAMQPHSAKWGTPILTLSAYLRFWSIACFVVTLWLIFVQKEVRLCYTVLAHARANNPASARKPSPRMRLAF
jgi:hypothetical protein